MPPGYDPLDLPLALGARLSLPAGAKRYVFVLLVIAISAELVRLAWRYVFKIV